MAATAHRIPGVGALQIPLSRSRGLMLLVAFNFAFLGLETWLAHWIDRTVRLYEWIPVVAGPIMGVVALWIALRPRPTRPEVILLLLTLVAAVAVGILGSAFHWERAMIGREAMPQGQMRWLVFAPPVAGPMAFAGVALVGLMAMLHEQPRGSGRMTLWGLATLRAPISKTRQLLLLVGLGYAAAMLSAILDHARSSFDNPTVWVAVIGGAFATWVTFGRMLMRKPSAADHVVFFWTQVLMIGVGVLGAGLHLSADMTPTGHFSLERLINHAPVFAPMLYANLGIFGLISVLEPVPQREEIINPSGSL